MQEILVFQQDRSAEVRRFVVGFIEEAWQVLHSIFITGLMSLKSQCQDSFPFNPSTNAVERFFLVQEIQFSYN